jgi:prenyltransferase beta subunit
MTFRSMMCFIRVGFVCSLGIMSAPLITNADTATGEDLKFQKAFDAANDRALAYLAKVQLPDGSWPGNMKENTAIASLCVMAFLARGYTPDLPPYGSTINRGIDFVLGSQNQEGSLTGRGGGQMYSHNISTLMLSEVSGMVNPERQKRLDDALAKALKLILDAQRVVKSESHRGGWRYETHSKDSDISHSGWALMALRSARNNGAPVPREAIDDAVRFILRCSEKDGGFAYQPGGGSGISRTGVGLLCLELSGRHRDAITTAAATYITREFDKKWNERFAFYTLYYASQAMFQFSGDEWEKFAPKLYDTILKLQATDGSWAALNNQEGHAGSCYCTSMAVLALSVSYRQLPIYQR